MIAAPLSMNAAAEPSAIRRKAGLRLGRLVTGSARPMKNSRTLGSAHSSQKPAVMNSTPITKTLLTPSGMFSAPPKIDKAARTSSGMVMLGLDSVAAAAASVRGTPKKTSLICRHI